MMGAFLIPIVTSSLRGLTHVLTCQEQARTPFSLTIDETGDVVVITSEKFERGGEQTLCGGLVLDMGARLGDVGEVAMQLTVINRSPYTWRGTIELAIGDTTVPVDIGEIPAGGSGADTVPLSLDPGVHELTGSLLIGP